MNQHEFLTSKAVEFLRDPNNAGEQPEFSMLKGTQMIFNDNSAADEIENFLTQQGENAGLLVSPVDIVNATLEAQKQLTPE